MSMWMCLFRCSLQPPQSITLKDERQECLLPVFAFRKQGIEFLFVSVVVEIFVEIGACLHQRDDVLLCAFATYGFVDLQGCGVHGAVGGAAVEDDVDTGGGEF